MVIEKDFMVIYCDDMLVLSPTKMVGDIGYIGNITKNMGKY